MSPVLIYTQDMFFGKFIQSVLAILSLQNNIASSKDQVVQRLENNVHCLFISDFFSNDFFLMVRGKYKNKKIPVIYILNDKILITDTSAICLSRPLNVHELINAINCMLKKNKSDYSLCSLSKMEPPYLIGNSKNTQKLRKTISEMSLTDFSVMIQGDTGTGKGVVAKALHANSIRHDQRFLEVNCATLPAPLMESELFGYEKGAFTGAWASKGGKFQAAANGTLFLDEIGEMAPWMQAKLLQVLQDGEFSPLGANTTVSVDVRILSATNVAIQTLLKASLFRTDLFYRLAVISLVVSPLKERPDDIVPLAVYFLELFASRYQKKVFPLSSELWELLMVYDWPGNVRELENTIHSIVALDSEGMLKEKIEKKVDPGLHDAKQKQSEEGYFKENEGLFSSREGKLKQITSRAVALAEKALIDEALKVTQGNKKEAANLLQMSYKSLLQKLKAYSMV